MYTHDHEMQGTPAIHTASLVITLSTEGWSTSNKEDLVFYASYRQLHDKIIHSTIKTVVIYPRAHDYCYQRLKVTRPKNYSM